MEKYFIAHKSFCRPIYGFIEIDNYDVIKAFYVNLSKICEKPSVKSICEARSKMQMHAYQSFNDIPYNSNLLLLFGHFGPKIGLQGDDLSKCDSLPSLNGISLLKITL